MYVSKHVTRLACLRVIAIESVLLNETSESSVWCYHPAEAGSETQLKQVDAGFN